MKQLNLTAVIVSVLAAGVVLFAIWWIYTPVPKEVAICERLVPGSTELGFNFSSEGEKQLKLNFGTKKESQQGSSELYLAFIACINKEGASVRVVNGVNIVDVEPLGEVADHWKSSADMKLVLSIDADSKVLPNLKFGPAVGTKANVVGEWCAKTKACVTCNPELPKEDTAFVEITLKPTPPVTLKQVQGISAPPEAGSLWPIEDAKGTRQYYECAHP